MFEHLSKIEISEQSVKVDGEEMASRLSGLRYTHVAGEQPILELQLRAGADPIHADAIVRYTQPAGVREAIIEWLSTLHGDDLDKEVLGRMDWSPRSNGELVLEVLKEWANGA